MKKYYLEIHLNSNCAYLALGEVCAIVYTSSLKTLYTHV